LAQRLTHIQLTSVEFYVSEGKFVSAYCSYVPQAGNLTVARLAGSVVAHRSSLEKNLSDRIGKFIDAARALVGAEEYEIEGSTVDIAPEISAVMLAPENEELRIVLADGDQKLGFGKITEGQRRLISSILSSMTAVAWKDLHRRVGLGTANRTEKPQVFISYRHGHEKFAEASARRLGQEGLVPWFDRWDIRAGDSLPGKIEEAFAHSIAFIPILTSDYEEGSWATEEMRTAISKRVDEGYRIVPVLLEQCDRPELIKQLVYVDMTAQDPQDFESKVADVVDGIFGLEANPFR
jgi:TIR domain